MDKNMRKMQQQENEILRKKQKMAEERRKFLLGEFEKLNKQIIDKKVKDKIKRYLEEQDDDKILRCNIEQLVEQIEEGKESRKINEDTEHIEEEQKELLEKPIERNNRHSEPKGSKVTQRYEHTMDFYNNNKIDNHEKTNNFGKSYSYEIDHKKALENAAKSKKHSKSKDNDKSL